MVAAPAAVANGGFLRVEFGELGQSLTRSVLNVPEAIPPPGVEAAVVTSLAHGVKDIAEVDQVATEGPLTKINTGAPNVVDGTVANGDALCHRYLDTGGLFLNSADGVNQAVIHDAVCRVVV